MAQTYLQTRIREALQQAHGNRLQAQRLLQQWARDDSRLLYALAGPALPGLVARAMQGAAAPRRSRPGKPSGQAVAAGDGRAAAMAMTDLDSLVAQMGANFARSPAPAPQANAQDTVLRQISKEQLKRRLQRDHGWPSD